MEKKPLPSLVVCPPTLTGHWCYEVEKFCDVEHLNPLHYYGAPSDRQRYVVLFHHIFFIDFLYERATLKLDLSYMVQKLYVDRKVYFSRFLICIGKRAILERWNTLEIIRLSSRVNSNNKWLVSDLHFPSYCLILCLSYCPYYVTPSPTQNQASFRKFGLPGWEIWGGLYLLMHPECSYVNSLFWNTLNSSHVLMFKDALAFSFFCWI